MKSTDFTDNILSGTRQRASVFLRLLCESVVDTSRPKTPKKDGNLRQDVLKQVNGTHGRIEWRKGYAAAQEQGFRTDSKTGKRVYFKKYTTPGTGPHYAKNAVQEAMKKTFTIAKMANLI